jgi:hypothetical protein
MLDLLFWGMWFGLIIAGIIIVAQRNEINDLKKANENLKLPF